MLPKVVQIIIALIYEKNHGSIMRLDSVNIKAFVKLQFRPSEPFRR